VSIGVTLLIAAVIVLAVWIVAHVALVVRVWPVTEITTFDRGILVVFPFWLGWKHGKRKHAVLWACLIVLYAILRACLR